MRIVELTQESKKNLLADLLKRSTNDYGNYEEIVNKVYRVGTWDPMYEQDIHQNKTIAETIGKIDGKNSITDAINKLTGNEDTAVTLSTAI